jgi:solute carrier family 25 phosphate transporter 3
MKFICSNQFLLFESAYRAFRRYFAAGGVCAACSHGITTPIDVVKTKMQSDPSKYDDGMIFAAVDIVKEHGLGFLLAGLGPTVLG